MSRFMSAVWVVQLFVLLALTAACVAQPGLIFSFFEGCRTATPEPGCALIATDRDAQSLFALVRLLAPYLFAFALITLQAVMHEDERVRRGLSFILAFTYAGLTVLIATGSFMDSRFRHADFAPRVLFAALLTLILLSVYDAIRAGDRGQRALSLLFAAVYAALAVLDQRSVSARVLAVVSAVTFLLDTLMVERERLRARLFAVALLLPAVFAATDSLGGVLFSARFQAPAENFLSAVLSDEPLSGRVFLALTAFCAVIHALYAGWPMDPAARRLSGSANTRPPSLWALWLAQGLMFLTSALLFFFWFRRNDLFGLLRGVSDAKYGALFEKLKAIYPVFLTGMALFSFSSMQSSREWLWKARCLTFSAFWASQLLSLLVIWNIVASHAWAAALTIFTLLMLAVHIWFQRSRGEWFSEEVGEGPDGWIFIDLVLGPLLLLKTLLSGRRATHARGVAAWGSLRVLPPGERPYPAHDFFQPGRELPLQIRFANERSDDDVAADARGAAIRLSSSDKSPFDLLLSTGSYSAAENVLEMGQIALANALGRPGRRWLAKNRRFLEGGIAALRRAPESYTQLWYHSQTVRFWVAQDNERYLVRYRLVPWPLPDEETGLPVSIDDFIDRRRSPADRRPTDYLRRELKMRLEANRRDILRLQAQFHKIRPEDGVQWYSPATDWHADRHPWIDLAELTLEDVLSDEDAERLCYNPDNAPSSLGTPVSRSFLDPRSIADSERRVMRRVQSLRQWRNETFGLPSRMPGPVD